MKAGKETQDSLDIPSFDIESVTFEVIPNEIVVSTFGSLPMYQSHRFEDAVKSMLISHSETIQEDLKNTF